MKHHTVEDRWGWIERITGALLIAAVVCAVLLALSAGAASAGSDTPYKVRTTGTLREVSCAGPCCCGTVTATIGHVRYEAIGYCKWFRTLRNGDTVRTMLYRTGVEVW
jgi:hypothetical protein